MTDNKIIKAFECCYTDADCEECPLYSKENHRCTDIDAEINIPKEILDLINRQQTEIERLRDNLKAVLDEAKESEAEYEKVYEQAYNDARANLVDGGASCRLCMAATESKAYKEFAEKLKEKAVKTYYGELVFTEDDFDNILKEMGCE